MGNVDAKTGNKRDDYYTYIPKNEKYQRAFKYTEDRSQQYFVVKNEEEGKNAIHYLMSDFARLCCYVSRETIGRFGYQFLPALDFSKSYTEEELFNMIGMEYNKEEIDKILPDFYGTRK